MAYLRVNDIDLYYEEYGSGTPLVLLYGNGEDHTTFSVLGEALRHRFHIYAFDSRGHGLSSSVSEYHYADMATDIAKALETLFDSPVDILGFSDGGVIALFLGIWFPKLIRRMIICGSNYHPYGIKQEGRIAMQQEYNETHNPLMPLMLQEPWLSQEDLHQIQCPVYVVAGENDIIEDAHTRELASFLPNSHLLIMENEDHTSYVVGSDLLSDLCESFFHGDR